MEPFRGPVGTARVPAAAWHSIPAEEVLQQLGTSAAGLSADEVRARRARHGPNALAEAQPIRTLAILIRQFKSLLVGLLIVAALVSGIMGEWLDSGAILAIVALNAVLGFYQEWGAERSIAALRRLTAPHAKVRRAGQVSSVPAAGLVPGDIVLLEAGDLVAADLRLLDVSSLRCVESALTGESEPVDKTTESLARAGLPLGDRSNLTFMGTSVAAGAGSGVVVATGMTTELGGIAHLLSQAASQEAQTPLAQQLHAFGRLLVWACLGIVALLFGLGWMRNLPSGELVLTAISLAVAAVPEGLPAVATVALALGVTRMARRRALVRRLPAVETLGSANVICTDKTGTLTVGEMTVRALFVDARSLEVTGEGYGPEGSVLYGGRALREPEARLARELLTALVSCSDAYLRDEEGVWKVVGDPTEGALLAAGAKLGIQRESLEEELPRLREWPFDATRKRMSVARRFPGGATRVFVKGAPEAVVARCDRIWTAQGVRELTDADRARIDAELSRLAERALRVLAAAWRDAGLAEVGVAGAEDVERGLVLIGLVGMYDPPRAEARAAVSRCRDAGIRVVMITGDHPRTGLAVARELGIAQAGEQVMSGTELDALPDSALAGRAGDISVYARVSAEHKLRIIQAWKARGAVVAMTGDGVNDAPAIRGADIGIAMGRTGTEVTKEASDMIITDDNFASIVAAVEEGRGIFANIRKTLLYLLAGNTGELLMMGTCIALGYPVPLLPIHLLWINLVTDGLPALCLATDPIESDVMQRPPRQRGQSLADRAFLIAMLTTGLLTAAVSLAVYLYGLAYEDEIRARTHAFAVLVFAELLRAFSGRSETKPIWRMGMLTNTRLAAVVSISFILQVSSHHVEPMRLVLKTSFLPWLECAALVGAASVPVGILELIKVVRARGSRRSVSAGETPGAKNGPVP